jgi:CRISPR type IV-associated protein Csf2
LIDLTFGSPELAGRLFFKDALVDENFWFETFEVRNGVAINRDTETVEGSLLYDYEVVPAGTRFDFALTLENAADWQLGMILLALRAWQQDGVQIGGFRSRGLGYVKLDITKKEYHAVQQGDVDSALRMICDAETLQAIGITTAEEAINEADWLKAFRKQLTDLAQQEVGHA